MREILANISDVHSGHKLGLMLPGVQLQEDGPEGEPQWWEPCPNATQKLINSLYASDVLWLRDLAGDDPVTVVLNGDLTQGDKYPREWVSTRKADQISIAVHNLKPLFQVGMDVQRVLLAKGTGSHELGEGSSTILIADQLRPLTNAQVEVAYHYEVSTSGTLIDIAHHGPGPGIRKWLEGNVLRLYAQSIMQSALEEGKEPPRLVVRSHYHTMTWQTVRYRVREKFYSTDIVILPAYSGLDDFARQATRSKGSYHIGMVAAEIVDGELVRIYPHFRIVDGRRKLAW